MLEVGKLDEEKLNRDIAHLNKENWEKVRKYVTKLRQLQRMDNNG